MAIVNIDERSLKEGLLGLVIAIVEIIKETLRLETLRRMDGGTLTPQETERLGQALMDLDEAVEQLKVDLGVAEAVKAVRDGLDRAVGDILDTMLAPAPWNGAA
jgi:hypothetical protein